MSEKTLGQVAAEEARRVLRLQFADVKGDCYTWEDMSDKNKEYWNYISEAVAKTALVKKDEKLKVAREALKTAKKELEDLWSFYGKGLEVRNWHLNGDTIPLDTLFEDNNSNALEVADKAIKQIEEGV